MKLKLAELINKPLSAVGLKISRKMEYVYPKDMQVDPHFIAIYEGVKRFTMTSVERCFALYNAVNYVIKNNIPGDFVECGVWRGGSTMIIAKTLLLHNIRDRKIYLYDTFQGMTRPGDEDGAEVTKEWAGYAVDENVNNWAYSPIDEVTNNMKSTGYPLPNMEFIQGKVEDTIPQKIPSQVCLLRLDTDWYESTKHELKHLFPILAKNGILIIDDYGHWEGAKKAVDEYFALIPNSFLSRIDYTGRILIK